MWKLLSPPITLLSGRKARRSLLTNWALKVVKSQSLRVKPVTPPVNTVVMVPPKPFKKASQIKLVASQPADWDRIKALDVATNVLQRNPNIKAIYCANDTMAMGVAQADRKRRKNGKSAGRRYRWHSGSPQNGGSRTNTATVAQNPADIGATGLKLMVDAEKSGKVIPLDKAPEFKLVDSILVTQ